MTLQITDTVHGMVVLDKLQAELLDTPEVQRLKEIRQLGLAYLVFPGANHTRLEHSLGTSHVAGMMATELGLKDDERKLVTAAGMLHDLGHVPYSHTFESVVFSKLGFDHMDLTESMIRGENSLTEETSIPAILEKHGLSPGDVSGLIKGARGDATQATLSTPPEGGQSHFSKERLLHQLIHSTLDADQLDFLQRDSYYTGVAHGVIDLQRLVKSARMMNGGLAVSYKGVPAVEGMLVARALMYTSVYYHKTIRIASMMMVRAVQRALNDTGEAERILSMCDGGFDVWLRENGERAAMDRLLHRRLYKMAWGLKMESVGDGERETLRGLVREKNIRELERDFSLRCGGEEGDVIIDVPERSLLLSEPRIRRTDIPVIDKDGKVKPFFKHSALAPALARRMVSPWAVIVSCEPSLRRKVAEKAKAFFERTIEAGVG